MPILKYLRLFSLTFEHFIPHTAIFKMANQQDLLYSTWNSAQCYVAAWMGGEFKGEWIHVYVWLGPFPIHLKLS